MGKFLDFIMCDGDWEKMQRIQLYKKISKKAEENKENGI